ncbi:conserved Plasmodium protein, unknown function [Plasmodium gallinaceum]|uniref:Origin recognition complex subunit 1 n=1 Tax=Plasmodium gallinaceum TaxID=5849 RepID=A0A1J1GUT3_PLAGA|nr:conserved Plasmodium protein, unknown function [Plasmodium gallinaceum]CRG95064.1 conserved Plasmodium protein, unknown function [Plasmodium gallinaceum]
MRDLLNKLTLENIANVKIRAYKNDNFVDENEKKEKKNEDNFYNVYILTYIKHIVRIKANLALHGGLYSNYFEKYEEESISNIMLENLLNKNDLNKENSEYNGKTDKNIKYYRDMKKNEINEDNKRDLNYSIKELLKKLIKSYKIRENKIFLVTGMMGCGKTTCVSLAIEYFNKFLQIEKNMQHKNDKKSVLFLSVDENNNKKTYKKTPYTSKSYEQGDVSYESLSTNDKKIRINYNEPLFNFTPRKKKKRKTSNSSEDEDDVICNSNKKKDNSLNLNLEQINNNIKNIFENDDLSPLRKNANIRNKIQFEQIFKEHETSNIGEGNENENSEFNEKYRKIVEEIKAEENEERCIYTIRISAYLYKDDLQCIKSILSQLYNYLNKEEKMETNLLLNDYIIKLENILIEINNNKKQTLLIIENVEKFCLQNKQNLLYTLFDLLHKKNICINIICLTNVLDITQNLEKRIKSRFTFEMIHISPILNIDEISKLVYKILYVNLDDFHLIKKYYSVYFSYSDLIKIQKFLQIYNSTMQKEIADSHLLKQWSYDINYGLDIRHIYHTCVDAILSICEYKHILNSNRVSFKNNTLLDSHSDKESNSSIEYDSYSNQNNANSSKYENEKGNENNEEDVIEIQTEQELNYENYKDEKNFGELVTTKNKRNKNNKNTSLIMEKLGFFSKEKRNNVDYFKERQGKLDSTPVKSNFNKENKENKENEDKENLHFNVNIDMSPRKLKENIKLKSKVESEYILNNVQSKFIRRHYIKKVLRDLCTIEYLILCAFTRLYKKEILPKTLYVIILEINKFKQAYPQEQIIGFSLDAYRRSFFRLVDLDIIILSSYSLSHLNIKNFSNDLFGLHEPTKFPCFDIFLDNIESYNLNHNLIQWVKHNTEVMQ